MNSSPARRVLQALSLLLFCAIGSAQSVGSFSVKIPEGRIDAPFSGDILIAFAEQDEPRRAMHGWFNAPPVLRFRVTGLATGTAKRLVPAQAVASVPLDWKALPAKEWRVQAVLRTSLLGRQAGLDEGDLYSAVATITYDPSAEASVELILDQVASKREFVETERIVEFEFPSPALSAFHGFDYSMHAGVMLPRHYEEGQSYPVLYSVTGFGGTHHGIHNWLNQVPEDSPLDDCIVVIPDATNHYGHSVFCDSDSIGPWGQALVHELIPALEKKFGGAGKEQRYVTGISSGGWSSLWLQVAYPEEFAGCWSHVPDPIDFHDFQQINIYEPLPSGEARNMYLDEAGERRPLARRNGQVLLYYEDFARREHVLNPGGQIRSFEATFSPLDADGTPRRIFDVHTGRIDHEAAKAWRKYDISHHLLTNWASLQDSLSGKIHLYAGAVDTFYLEGAVERFQSLAQEAGLLEHMTIEVVPGMPHTQHQAGFQAMVKSIESRRALLLK